MRRQEVMCSPESAVKIGTDCRSGMIDPTLPEFVTWSQSSTPGAPKACFPWLRPGQGKSDNALACLPVCLFGLSIKFQVLLFDHPPPKDSRIITPTAIPSSSALHDHTNGSLHSFVRDGHKQHKHDASRLHTGLGVGVGRAIWSHSRSSKIPAESMSILRTFEDAMCLASRARSHAMYQVCSIVVRISVILLSFHRFPRAIYGTCPSPGLRVISFEIDLSCVPSSGLRPMIYRSTRIMIRTWNI